MRVIRSTIFSLGMLLSTLVMAPISVLTFPLPFLWRYRVISQWARFNLWWLEATCKLSYRVEGLEHITEQNGVILCKHQSAWETLALQRIFPPQVWMLKRELLWIPFFGWGLAMLEPIAIDRGSGRKAMAQLLEQGRKRLESGRWVVIFPEGTRVAPGQRRDFRRGGATLAATTGFPVVPVAHNAGEYWPRRSFIKRPGVIRVVVGPVIETQGRTAEEINAEAQQWIESTMQEISFRDRAGVAVHNAAVERVP